jgi:polysaccharide export outer membrane protein
MKLLHRAAALTALLASAAFAQQQPPAPSLQSNPIAALQAFEPSANAPYQLGRGDEITVDAIGRPELTGQHIIGPDGKITMPIAGSVEIAGLTRDQAAGAIEHALDPFYSNVVISIGVDKYTSNEVIVLGAVQHPGVINFDRTPTLLEVVSRASTGAETGSAVVGQSAAGDRPSGIPEEVVIYRGNDTMATVQLRKLVEEGSPLANMRLERNDIIYVTGKTSFISVLGEVSHPGNLHLEPDTTLYDLLAQAGGPTEKAGRNPSIEIIHQNGANGPTTHRTIAFNTLLHHRSIDLTLQSGDIIYVPESGFNKASYAFQQLSPLFNLVTVGALLGGQ